MEANVVRGTDTLGKWTQRDHIVCTKIRRKGRMKTREKNEVKSLQLSSKRDAMADTPILRSGHTALQAADI